MSLSPWTVALISTGYDMMDIRADLAEYLTQLGFGVLAYERTGFPVRPSVHSHEACVLALDQADIAVLVIDKRYGGLYLGVGDISITEKEYQTATKKREIVIPCIRKSAWDERHQMFEAAKQLRKGKRRLSPRKALQPNYVQNWDVLDFIERVRKAAKDNFVIIFDNVVDLKIQLRGRLEGLSHWLLMELVRDQTRVVRNIKTTTGMAFSLGDVLDKGYFVDPPFTVRSGPSGRARSSSRLTEAVKRQKACMAVLGEPGSGKSTLLGKAFLAHAKSNLKDNLTNLPFFVLLRGRGKYAFEFPDYVGECFGALRQKQQYPLMKLDRINPTFYLDGLDEMSEEQAGFDVARFCQSGMFRSPFMLSCRSRFASEFLNDVAVGNRLTSIIELKPWGPEITSTYIKEFCRIRRCKRLMAGLQAAFSGGGEMQEIATNPLLLTLFLCLVEETKMRVPLDVRNKRTLFAKTLEMWARRELGRFRGSGGVIQAEADLLLRAWRVAGWHIYCSRFTAAPSIRLDDLLSKVKAALPEAAGICEREAFVGLFDVRSHTDDVTGLIHEQLLEELVAELLCEGMRAGCYPFPASLAVAVRWEINQLIRSMWTEAGAQPQKDTLANLVRAFHSNLVDNSPAGVLQRNQAAYYMGRLNIPEADTELRNADTREANLFVKLSLGFGLTKRLQFDVEESFVQRLRDDPDWDAGNRGYHLFYYHDWHVGNAPPPYRDPGNVPWKNTLQALLRHIEGSEMKHVAIRRVELFTIRRFIESRGAKGPLTADVLGKIGKAVGITTRVNYPSLPAGFEEQLAAEYSALRAAWSVAR